MAGSFQSQVSKDTYERVATIAEALPEPKREEFAALLDDLQRNALGMESIRFAAIRRWLRDIRWGN